MMYYLPHSRRTGRPGSEDVAASTPAAAALQTSHSIKDYNNTEDWQLDIQFREYISLQLQPLLKADFF